MEDDTQRATHARLVATAVQAVNTVIVGKDRQVRLCLACLLADGHLLIEDIPGVGKTTLAHSLAKVLNLGFRRIQFTSDLLPADIIGATVYERENGNFRFHPGPVFSQIVLADEINRATPKTQSALLESMEERQVTIDGELHPLPKPFFVIATQNPVQQAGTFELPESQLDRFLMRVELGYPGSQAERELLRGTDRREILAGLQPVLDANHLGRLQAAGKRVHTADALLDYIQAIVTHTRESDRYVHGLSPRAALAIKTSAQVWALMEGRQSTLPEDVQAVLPGIVGHRLRLRREQDQTPMEIAHELLQAVPVS